MDHMKKYLEKIGKYPVLDRDSETELFRTARGKDEKAAEKAVETLAEHNLRLVVSVAKKYMNRGIDFADLIQVGNVGLMKAISKFDVSKDIKFSTYATWWIRQGLTRCVKKDQKTVFLPEYVVNMIVKVKRMERELENSLGRKPTLKELSKASGFSESQVKDAQEYAQQNISLQAKIGEDGSEYGELLQDAEAEDPSKKVSDGIVRDYLAQSLLALNEKEKELFEYRYGVVSKGYTEEELAAKWKVSPEKISELKKRAMKKLDISEIR